MTLSNVIDERADRVVPDVIQYEISHFAERFKIIMPRNQLEPLQTFSTCLLEYGDESVSPQQSEPVHAIWFQRLLSSSYVTIPLSIERAISRADQHGICAHA
jgi:hypothetical protein